MPLKCSNDAQCFCLTKILEKNASIMYKSLPLSFQSGPIIRVFRTNWFIFTKKKIARVQHKFEAVTYHIQQHLTYKNSCMNIARQ